MDYPLKPLIADALAGDGEASVALHTYCGELRHATEVRDILIGMAEDSTPMAKEWIAMIEEMHPELRHPPS